MTWMALGSLALPHQLGRQGVALRTDMARLSLEMTTGQAARPAHHLGGDLAPFAALESRSARISATLIAARSALSMAATTQSTLDRIAKTTSDGATRLLTVTSTGADAAAVRSTGVTLRGAFSDAVAALGTDVAGRALFSGTATDRAPLIDAGLMLDAVAGTAASATSADDVAAMVDAAFNDPGGLFETMFFQGGAAAPGATLDPGTSAPPLPTAGAPELRRTLGALITGALVADDRLALGDDQRRHLARLGGEGLLHAGAAIVRLQASVGHDEAMLDATITQLTGERDGLILARDAMLGVDPFDAANRLQAAQTHLELIYAVTARTARLSLAQFL